MNFTRWSYLGHLLGTDLATRLPRGLRSNADPVGPQRATAQRAAVPRKRNRITGEISRIQQMVIDPVIDPVTGKSYFWSYFLFIFCGSGRIYFYWPYFVGKFHYPLVICYIAIENDHKIVDLPIENGVSFHSYVNVYQRVNVPYFWSYELWRYSLKHRET